MASITKEYEIIRYKNKIIDDILHTESISPKLIEALDVSGTETHFLYKYIYPYPKLPSDTSEVKAFLTIQTAMQNLNEHNHSVKDMLITLKIIVHDDLMKLSETAGYPRSDYIASLLNSIFNGRKGYGLDPLTCISSTENRWQKNYHIRTLKFLCHEPKLK